MAGKLTLKSGKTLQLPLAPDQSEFLFPSNCVEHLDGHLAGLYDPVTQTGLIWTSFPHSNWMSYQPCERAWFFDECVPYRVQQVCQNFNETLDQRAGEAAKHVMESFMDRFPFLRRK